MSYIPCSNIFFFFFLEKGYKNFLRYSFLHFSLKFKDSDIFKTVSKRKIMNSHKEIKETVIEPETKKSKEEININEKWDQIRKKILELFVNTKDGNIKNKRRFNKLWGI